MPYYSSYGGSGEIIIHDFEKNETTRQVWGENEGDSFTDLYTDFHMQPAYYTNQKLAFYVWAEGKDLNGQAIMLLVYDPAVNRITYVNIPDPPGPATNVEGGAFDMNENGLIYGIGWDKMNDGYVPLSFDVENTIVRTYNKIATYPGPFTVNYRQCKAVGNWAYAAIGNNPWRLIAFNFETGEGKILAEADITGDYKTIELHKVQSGDQRGIKGSIRNATWIQTIGDCRLDEYHFWLFDGEIHERTDDLAPWTGQSAQDLTRPPFQWAREGQVWSEDFVPPAMPLEQIAASTSDVTRSAADAVLSTKDPAKAGWTMLEDPSAFGSFAIQADALVGESNANGTATVDVTFTESGTYYLYYRAKTKDTDGNGITGNNDTPRFSRGDTQTPWSTETQRAAHQVRSLSYEWEKAWESEYGEAFIYTIEPDQVGTDLKFEIETFDAGVTIDQILFSKNPNLQLGQTPIFVHDKGRPNPMGLVEFPFRFEGSTEPDTLKYQVKMYDGVVRRVLEINDSILVATDEEYGQTVFYNLYDGSAIRIDGRLSPYSMAFDKGEQKLYISGYPNSQMYIYDLRRGPDRHWSPPNPVLAGYLGVYKDGENTHCPLGTEIGADQRIYNAGTTYGRTRDGGGMGWYDTTTGEVDGFYLPEFENHRVFWTSSALNGRYILFSTKPTLEGDQGRIYCWDTQLQDFAYHITPPGVFVPGPLEEVFPGLMMGFTKTDNSEIGRLYGFEAKSGKVLWTKDVPANPVTAISLVRRHAYSFRQGPDRHIWAFLGNTLVRIDPTNIEIKVVGKASPAQLAFAKNGVYTAGGHALRRFKDVPVETNTSSIPNTRGKDMEHKVHPNPTSGIINIEPRDAPIQQIRIYNMKGELIIQKTPADQTEVIDLSAYPNGLYFIQTSDLEGRSVSKILKK